MKNDDDFWSYHNGWRQLASETRPVRWRSGWVENDYCGDCRYCCGPQGDDEPFPMALLPRQINAANARDFYMLDADTAYIGAKGCKSDTAAGCRLDACQKPVACGLFPIVLINGGLYLYQKCPAVLALPLRHFFCLAKDAQAMLKNIAPEDLRHISISLPCEALASKYIDLHIQIFADVR